MQPGLFDAPPSSPRRDPPDQAERDFAIDPRHHVVLEASAGTGKTRVLVDRYVRLIEAGVDPRHILAITFTRKAAAEMRERVLVALEARAREDAAMATRWRALRERLADVNISTIDAFCFGLLREFPLEADVDPAFEIADETEVPRFVSEAIEIALRDCRALVVTDEHVRLLFARVRPRDLRHALGRLIEARYVALPAVGRFVRERVHAASVDAACASFVDRVRARIDASPFRDALLNDGPRAAPEFEWLRRDLAGLASFPVADHVAVRRLRSRLERYFGTAKKPRKQAANAFHNGFPGPEPKRRHTAAVRELAPMLAAEVHAFDVEISGLLARGFARVLVIAVRRYESLLAEHSVLDFPGMLAKAVALLSRREEFARSRLKLQSRFHHLLIDEFQDTSRLQWQLVRSLADAWREGESAEETSPSIFIVGDRKQSIYRFRHAEVTLLDDAAEFIDSLRAGPTARRAIQHSFRAVPELLAFVNALSTEITGAADLPDAFQYRETDRFPGVRVAPGARRDGEPVLGLAVAASLEDSAAAVATEVDRLLRERVAVRDRDGARPIRRDDIAILFRSRAGHRAFEDALEARGIPTYVYKGLGFFDAPEVQDLQALIRYLAAPESNLRAAEFLRSRVVRVSDAALVRLAPDIAEALRAPGVDLAAAGLDAQDAALFARARASVSTWLGLLDRIPPGDLIDRVLTDAAYLFEMRGRRLSQARENVKKVRALIRRIQNHGYATMARLADYFQTLHSGEESNAIVAAQDAVQLMTIHAAKGLEFPVVFLVRMNAGVGGGSGAIAVVVKDAGGEPDVTIGIGSAAKTLEARRDVEETRRLLYVAVTRARDRLYLAAEVEDGTLGRRRQASFATLLPDSLRAALASAATATAADIEWAPASGETFAFRVCRSAATTTSEVVSGLSVGRTPGVGSLALSADPTSADPTPGVLPTRAAVDRTPLHAADVPRLAATAVERPDDDRVAAASSVRVADRLVGTLVHRLFQRDSMLADRDALLARARTLLTPAELADADEGDLPRAVEAFLALRDREDVSQLLSSGERFFEVPFSYRPEGEPAAIIRGTIDCLIVRPAGAVIVVEFKTGRPRPEHERQVATYVAALCAAWPGRAVESRLVYASDIG